MCLILRKLRVNIKNWRVSRFNCSVTLEMVNAICMLLMLEMYVYSNGNMISTYFCTKCARFVTASWTECMFYSMKPIFRSHLVECKFSAQMKFNTLLLLLMVMVEPNRSLGCCDPTTFYNVFHFDNISCFFSTHSWKAMMPAPFHIRRIR